MEVALSQRFLNSMTLFSLIYDNYERDLKREIWLCHKNMDLTISEIEKMPIQDRKYYISLHNKQVEKEKEQFKQHRKNK